MLSKVRKFFGEIKVELSKVTWSTRQELANAVVIVLVAMVFLAVFVGIVDLFFSQLIRLILG